MITKINSTKRFTYERCPDGGGWERVGDDDEEDGVSQQQCDPEGDSLSAVRRQVEAHHVHHHQEYTGQAQVHRVEQWPPANHHLYVCVCVCVSVRL